MINIGTWNTLTALRLTSVGMYLGDDAGNDILLPNKYIPRGFEEGQTIEVFVYTDSEDRPIATTLKPKAEVGRFAYLTVRDTSTHGAFLDWGLEKDLFLPNSEQRAAKKVGERALVFVYLDARTGRTTSTEKYKKYLRTDDVQLTPGQEVNLIVTDRTELGYSVIVDEQYSGLVFNNFVDRPLQRGNILKGYVVQVRSDGKVDVRLRPEGYLAVVGTAAALLEALRANGGFLPIHDRTNPEIIRQRLHMSKKHFKMLVGVMFRKEQIDLVEGGIQLREPKH